MIAMKNILVATDFGEAADNSLTYGRELATRFDATLHVLHVAENVYVTAFGAETYASFAPDLQRDLEQNAQRRLHEAVLDSDGSGPRTVPVVMTSSSPAFAIIDYAREHHIDLIIMGTHGRGALGHILMGSVAERVVRLAPCPVLTIRQTQHDFIHPDGLVAVREPAGART
jgi:nucleotide-binding universal stress UspA family protein